MQHVYNAIGDRLRASIRRRALPAGTVLLAAPLAKLFGASRSPVKQALQALEKEGRVLRFGGRGVMVGPAGAPPRRRPLTARMVGLVAAAATIRRVPAWRTVYARVERDLVHRCIFGEFRINELELSRHYRIGRTVAHDVLTQLEATGIISRRSRGQWLTVPLDSRRVSDLFDLRILLEPRLCASARGFGDGELAAMRARLAAAAGDYPDVNAESMDELERDLHVRILERGQNVEFFAALRRTQCILISAKHVLGHGVPYPPKADFFFDEHLRVIDALLRRDGARAERALRSHLEASRERVSARLAEFRIGHKMKPLSFITAG